MNKDQLKAAAAVMLAAADGKQIEWRHSPKLRDSTWAPIGFVEDAAWNFHSYEYRVKPEPKKLYGVFNKRGELVTSWEDREDADRFCVLWSAHCYTIRDFTEDQPQ